MAEARLSELARRYGIEPEYRDVWDKIHEQSDETLRALLAAMRIDASDTGKVEASIAQHERVRWAQILPPAVVVRVSALAEGIRIQLPATLDGSVLAWRITEEGGTVFNGSFRPVNLTELESADVDGEKRRALKLPLAAALSPGYHRLAIVEGIEPLAETVLIVAPDRCYLPEAVADGGRVWGGALQLYSLRSVRNWGIGDYTDLALAVAQWGAQGAALIGVNPLHAEFLHEPAHASPYSPSSRLFLNVLYLDIEAIDDFAESETAREAAGAPQTLVELKRLREAELVDYTGVAAAKRALLEILYAHFRTRHLAVDSGRASEFRAFCAQRGEALRRYALFEAIQESLAGGEARAWGWQHWPAELRVPASAAVDAFAAKHAARVEFFEYLQWQAELQLAAVEERCFDAGLAIGLYADLAVSVDPGGAAAWSNQTLYSSAASIGAPPDEFNMNGQDWGLPPPLPAELIATGYASLIATVRANMIHAGALRIDHVMGLARLYWVPAGMSPRDGGYVSYPFEAALGILALESHRHRCMVVGEDLGTVPPEVRTGLDAAGVLSYRLLIFEHDSKGEFKAPGEYPRQALAAITTHDLPTIAGYWRSRDIKMRETFNQFPNEAAHEAQAAARERERAGLLRALEREHLLPANVTVDPASLPEPTTEFAQALHEYLARSPAMLMIAQLEDAMDVVDQVNLPGTVDQHPNWRRKLPLALEQWETDPRFAALSAKLNAQRPAPAQRPRARRRTPGVHIPRATYRLQLHRGFTFRDATRIVPYLAALGISHVYCSPYLRARSGSAHGYDIVDHSTLNPEIGTQADFDAFVAALTAHDMGQLIDVVPNHMGVMGADNAWWLDVLENGQASLYADFFDIDWQTARALMMAGRVLVPVLGDHYGAVLAAGELVLKFDAGEGSFSVFYHEHRLPIDPREYPQILDRAVIPEQSGAIAQTARVEFANLARSFGSLPPRAEHSAESIAARATAKQALQRDLARLAASQPAVAAAIDAVVRGLNGQPGNASSFDGLHDLLEAQAYRVAYWRVASDEINYRRFFDINDLAALRMENEAAFEATHRKIFDWLRAGAVDALRIDHVDGLLDPTAYCRRLQDRYRQLGGPGAAAMLTDPQRRPLYVVVEKIVAAFEDMPQSWGIYGATGYRFANVVTGLFVDTAAEQRITRIYQKFTGETDAFDEICVRSKHLILRGALASELMVLANRLARIAHANRDTRDYTVNTLRQALAEVIARFPVYRTYISDTIAESDRRYIEWAFALAKRHSRAADVSIFDFIKSVLLCDIDAANAPPAAAEMRMFARKFQQVTSPVMAKGVEDTALYIYNRLVSLNDVGGEPATFGVTVNAFHGASADRASNWPHTMLATSTHDNKRSEDVRARINVLSEFTAAWQLQLRRWTRMNRSKKREVDGEQAPSRNDEYLLYQTLIGTFPPVMPDDETLAAYRERIQAYMLKAVREAKVHTSWIRHNDEYEAAVANFVTALLTSGKRNLFLEHLRTTMPLLTWLGMLNSVSMTLIKYTSPGVPDCYQGNEFFDFSLVDPDNRRPVDFAARGSALVELAAIAHHSDDGTYLRSLFEHAPQDGRVKLYAIWRLLMLRRAHSSIFMRGGYTPLMAKGERAAHVIAYARRYAGSGVITIAGRLFGGLGIENGALPCGEAVWGDTCVNTPFLGDGTRLRNVLTGETAAVDEGCIRVAAAHAQFPGAVFVYGRGEIGAASSRG